jgi:hypothetical protein
VKSILAKKCWENVVLLKRPILSGFVPLRLPLIDEIAVDLVFAILPFFLLAALFTFFALLAAICHETLLSSV